MNHAIAFLMALLLWAAPQSHSRVESPSGKNRADIDSLIGYARQSPPEFAADALLRIAEASEMAMSEKREIIEEAFRFAAHARNPVKRWLVYVPIGAFRSREGMMAIAFMLDLDSLSLQCRAVKAMLKLDRKKARELFDQIQLPRLEPPDCAELMVYDFSAFYETLLEIAQTAFSREEMRAQEHINFVESHIGNIEWSDQLAITARVISKLKTTSLQLERLVHTFSLAMARVADGDRSFSGLLFPVMEEVKTLVSLCQSRGVALDELLTSLRAYLVKGLTNVRCSDTIGSREEKEKIKSFNDDLRLTNQPSRKEIRAIEGDNLKPAKIEQVGKLHHYWQSPKSKSMWNKIDKLGTRPDGKPLPEEIKNEAQWQIRLTDALNDMDLWDAEEEETEADYFHQKIALLHSLLTAAALNPAFDQVLGKYIDLLSRSDIQRSNPIEWRWRVFYLLKEERDERRLKILEAMRNSKNSSLYLFAELERALPQPEKKQN
jgi:hypothetical protein